MNRHFDVSLKSPSGWDDHLAYPGVEFCGVETMDVDAVDSATSQLTLSCDYQHVPHSPPSSAIHAASAEPSTSTTNVVVVHNSTVNTYVDNSQKTISLVDCDRAPEIAPADQAVVEFDEARSYYLTDTGESGCTTRSKAKVIRDLSRSMTHKPYDKSVTVRLPKSAAKLKTVVVRYHDSVYLEVTCSDFRAFICQLSDVPKLAGSGLVVTKLDYAMVVLVGDETKAHQVLKGLAQQGVGLPFAAGAPLLV